MYRLLNPSTFAGWFGRSLYHALVVFLITVHAYADEKSEMEELSMVALSGCIWLQAFVVTIEMKTSLFQLIVAVGMGPVLALKYLRYTYRSSAINILQQAERSRGPIFSVGGLESQLKSLEKDVASLSTSQSKFRNSVYEPLLSVSDPPPASTRRSIGPATFDFLQPAQSRLSSSYSRNCKDN
ncbi:hypothetical protein BHE74_00009411 [Ensete ventricosum]|nr:hypothetical protein GW17_00056042 [Ensete ventricosum]RWW82138.1 hypothetical protein BHE74_00009411 [Ensete ventricosum]RZR86093.1 hypothetical protein BHM03_00013196 [Ensete ventricosum]